METAMIFTTRDLDILRFLRWCRFVLAEDLTSAFYKACLLYTSDAADD